MSRMFAFLCLATLLLTGCRPSTPADAGFDPRGEWTYTLTSSNGNTYDTGMLRLSGSASRGTYVQLNFYEIEYEGEYTYQAGVFQLTGSQIWTGGFVDADTLSGTFNSPANDVQGTFRANRRK